MKIGFIGLGNMASAMIGGILKKELYSAEDIIGSDKSEDSVQKAAKIFGIHTTTDNYPARKLYEKCGYLLCNSTNTYTAKDKLTYFKQI